MSGRIDWQAPVVSAEASDKAGSFTRSRNWAELKSAFLDCFMPSNSVEESALRLATFKQAHQTVSAYYLCFHSECTRYAFRRCGSTCHPWAFAICGALCRSVSAWTCTLRQRVCLGPTKPVTPLREAVHRARRHEAANFTGTNPNANSSMYQNRCAIARQFTHGSQAQGNRTPRDTRAFQKPPGVGSSRGSSSVSRGGGLWLRRWTLWAWWLRGRRLRGRWRWGSVSYTHLTLPTKA